jgi:hypothetical protein
VSFGAGLLYTASTRLSSLQAERKEFGLVANEPLENAPPSLAFATVAMGAFRGLVVDVLWMRADRLKEEGKFFDAKQLADWITVMQPRFSAVWDFQAWNMAYNISVAMPASEPEERWKWVRNGYELLRDKGIEQNPHSIMLYRSLAWIFQHKISGVTDDVHKYYKIQLSNAVRPLIEPNTNEHFEQLRQAPLTLTELIDSSEEVAQLVAKMKKASPEVFGDEIEDTDFSGRMFAILGSAGQGFPIPLVQVFNDNIETEPFDKLVVFCQANLLRNTWKFDIDRMIRINNMYGPVDLTTGEKQPMSWEHPDAHAIYWAQTGLEIAGNKDEYSLDELNTDRIIFHSLKNLYRYGKEVIYNVPMLLPRPETDVQQGNLDTGEVQEQYTVGQTLYLLPDLRMFDSYNQAHLDRIDKYSKFNDDGVKEVNVRPLKNGHRNILEDAIFTLYMAGHIKKATEAFTQLRELYPTEDNDMPLQSFCRARMKDELDGLTITDAREMVLMMLREAYFRYAVGDDDMSSARENMAKSVCQYYLQSFGTEDVDRAMLPSIGKLRYMALIQFLQDGYYPENLRQSLLARIQNERPELYEQLEKERLNEQTAAEKMKEASKP